MKRILGKSSTVLNFKKYARLGDTICVIFYSIEVGQITAAAAAAAVNNLNNKRPSNSGLQGLADLPPVHPLSPRPGAFQHTSGGPSTRRTSNAQNSVPGSPNLGGRRGFSPVRDQRMFIASFCRLANPESVFLK